MLAILTLFLGGVIGLASGLHLQRERQGRDELHWLRGQMLDAADAFAIASSLVLSEIGPKRTISLQSLQAIAPDIANFRIAYVAAAEHIPRLELLFGVKSDVAEAARDEMDQLQVIRKALETAAATPAGPGFDAAVAQWENELKALAPFQERFRRGAQASVAKPAWPVPG